MGRSSSSKKVARAARAGGSTGQGRNLAWPAAVTALVVLGVALIVVSRPEPSEAVPPVIGDHWHAAYGVYTCDEFQPPYGDVVQGGVGGIHSHRDGLIHMHPSSPATNGEGANLEAFGESVGYEVTDTSISLPGDIAYENGDECDGEEGQVRLVVWGSADAEEGREITVDIAQYNPQDGEVLTLAFAPADADLPKPPSAGQAPTDVPNAPDVTIPGFEEPAEGEADGGEGDAGTDDGAEDDSTDTTAGEDETTSTSAETTTSEP